MNINQMRKQVAKDSGYGPAWERRVELMDDAQVIAIWHKFNELGTFEEAKRKLKRDGKQLSMNLEER